VPRRSPVLPALAAAAWLAGCTVGPDYRPPDLRVEGSYGPAAAAPRADAWWAALNDPALDGLVAAAAENNLDLRLARARVREARAQRAVVYGAAEPTLDVGGKYEHDRFSQNAAPFNAFGAPGFPWEYNLYQLGFDASWEVDVFGGTRRAAEAANAAVQAGEEDRLSVLVTLLGEVARTYVELRGAQDQRQIARHNLDVQQETLALTRDRFAKGVGNQLDVSRAAAQVADTAAALPLFDRREWQALHRLAVLTNQPLDRLLALRTPAPVPAAPEAVMVGVPADLLRRRPDVRRSERQLAAATARIGVAEAALYPKFSLTGVFNLQSASVEDLLDWRSRAFSIGPAVSWPIFQAGRLRAAVAVRTAQQEEALVTYEQTVQRAIEEVRDELVTLNTERTRRGALAQSVAADQDALDLARQLYTQGLADFLTVLDAQRQLFQAQDALAQSDTRVTTAVIALYKALGGGWETPVPPAPFPTTAAATAPATQPGLPTETVP
jgi:NodT family efflux transporter outer membrane factor (OMF) lipoprotein